MSEVQPLTRIIEAFAWSDANYDRITTDFFSSVTDYQNYVTEVCREFLMRAWRANGQPHNFVLKNPELSLHVRTLLRIWPKALIIGCVRDPRDQIASELDVVEPRVAMQTDADTPLPSIEKLISSYCAYIKPILGAADDFPNRVYLLRYEDLARWSSDSVDRLSQFTGLDLSGYSPEAKWDVTPEYLKRLAQRPSFSPYDGQPLSRARIGRYVERLPSAAVRMVECGTGDVMTRFGYTAAPAGTVDRTTDNHSFEFIIMAESGTLEIQALLLCASIRRFGGPYAGSAIAVISPRQDRRPSEDTVRKLESLGVQYVPLSIVSPCPEYGTSFRVLASSEYERRSTADTLILLDSDTVFLGEPDFNLNLGDVAARPVDVQGMCTTGISCPHDDYWRKLCHVCAVDYDLIPYVSTTVDKLRVKASYNGGLVVAKRKRCVFQRTEDYFQRSMKAGLRPLAGYGLEVRAGHGLVSHAGSEYWGSSQACLSLALSGSGLSVQTLPPTHNFPLHFYDHFLSEIEAGKLSNIVHVHYHHLFFTPSSPNPVLDGHPGFPSEGLTWLRERLGREAGETNWKWHVHDSKEP
jgi:hypothetical protein